MNRFILTLLALALTLRGVNAETEKAKTPDATAPKNAPASATVAEVLHVELKNKSAFDAQGSTRNPFWPIGWKPAAKLADPNAGQTGPDVPPNAFLVSSITIENNAKFAIVNGRVMQEGQQFGLQLGGQTYQVTLKRIEDGRVIIGRRDEEIVVPLRRK